MRQVDGLNKCILPVAEHPLVSSYEGATAHGTAATHCTTKCSLKSPQESSLTAHPFEKHQLQQSSSRTYQHRRRYWNEKEMATWTHHIKVDEAADASAISQRGWRA